MSAPTPSPLKQVFDAVDRTVTPQLEAITRSRGFADLLSVAVRVRHDVVRRARRASGWALHTVNLPTASDISRLRREVADTQRQVRALADHVALAAPRPTTNTTRGDRRVPGHPDSPAPV